MPDVRIMWVADHVKAGRIDHAECLARDIDQVPEYDWEPLMRLVGLLDATDSDATRDLYGVLDALVARGPRRISLVGSGVKMPIPD
jgi:hypothetical protein